MLLAKVKRSETSQVVQWPTLCSQCRGPMFHPWSGNYIPHAKTKGLPQWLSSKESACSAGATRVTGWILRLGRSPGERNGKPLQYFGLESPMDRGAWQVTVHGVAQSRAQLKRLSTAQHILCLQRNINISSVQFNHSVMSDSLRPHGLQHARLSSPSPTSLSNFQTFSHPQRNSFPISNYSLFPFPHKIWQSLVSFLSIMFSQFGYSI